MAEPVVNVYVSGRDLVLLSRDQDGRRRRRTVPPEYVVYLLAEDVDREFGRQLSTSRWVASYRAEGRWIRVGFPDRMVRDDMVRGRRGRDGAPSPFEERGIRVWEGDVHPVRRWLTDTNAPVQRPRRCYLDLETDSRVPFSRKEEARILSWAVVDPDGSTWSEVLAEETTRAEHDLLAALWERLLEYDQVLAWNGDGFDFPVLAARTVAAGVRVDPNQLLWLDHLSLFKRMNMHAAESGDEKRSMKLSSIARAILGADKDDFDASKTYEVWASGPEERERLRRYNVQDTDLLRRIEEKTGFAAMLDALASVCQILPDSRALQPTVQLDGYMLGLGLRAGIHFPTKHFREGLQAEQYEGAYVMQPKARGVERDVHVCDFAALYPSIMLSLNMSPETKVDVPVNGPIPEGHCRSPGTGQGFRVDAPGLLSVAIRDTMRLRKEHKDRKQSLPPGTAEWVEADRLSTAYKVVTNGFYGVVGSPYSRFFDRRIAESVTKTGKWLLLQTLSAAEDRGMRALYCDTDSVYVQNASRAEFEDFVWWINEEHIPKLMTGIGCAENHVKLAYEKQFSRIVFVSAKRYAGAFSHYGGKEATADSKPEVKGLEYKRGDATILAARLQEHVIDLIIGKDAKHPQECLAAVEAARQRVLHDLLPVEEVQLAKAVTKPLKEYVAKKKKDGTDGAEPPHVRVARLLDARGQEVREGTRIAYVVTDGDGGINAAIPAEDYKGDLDRYYLWENLVYPPTQRFLQAAFPDSDWRTNLESVRPPKVRTRKAPHVPEGQMTLGLIKTEVEMEPLVLVVEERLRDCLEELAAICRAHPGGRELLVMIHLTDGSVASLVSRFRIAAGEQVEHELADVIWAQAAIAWWEDACAS